MPLFSNPDRQFAEAVSELSFCNPFLPTRVAFERAALGDEYDESQPEWNVKAWNGSPGAAVVSPNVTRLIERCDELLERTRPKLARRSDWHEHDLQLYEDLILFGLFYHHEEAFEGVILDSAAGKPHKKIEFFAAFTSYAKNYLCFGDRSLRLWHELPHIVACLFQIRRAFFNIFHFIIGASAPAVQLRAAVWQSIFTHDMRRYRRVLFDRMADYTTLVTGPSGTGKELVARAVGLSRYIPFNPQTEKFSEEFAGSFYPLNLSALSPTLIESELFGHKRGAFTGAVEDRAGWLELCPAQGTVFLDEIGELAPALQVKLLRVLQDRVFNRLGETNARRFQGKLIAATNRDLASQLRDGEFREDLYYRLCSDLVVTPSLRQRLSADPAELRELVMHIAHRLVGDEAAAVAAEVLQSIALHLGSDYPWAGNIRELEQCVRNVLIRKEYCPATSAADRPLDARQSLLAAFDQGRLTADGLVQAYCTLVYAQTGSYDATARQIAIDRRTVKSKIDNLLLAQLRK